MDFKRERYGLICIYILCLSKVVCSQKLFVFYPSFIRPQILQFKLSEACPNLDITVFGRYPDFKRKIELDPPDALLTKPMLAERFKGFQSQLQGSLNGKTHTATALLALDRNIRFDSLSGLTIGVVDYMDRKGMDSLITSLFKRTPKTKHVTKPEDLFPLLRFNMAEAIFIEEREIRFFKRISKIKFNIAKAPTKPLEIISVATANKDSADKIFKAFKSLPPDILEIFGIDNWQLKKNKNRKR